MSKIDFKKILEFAKNIVSDTEKYPLLDSLEKQKGAVGGIKKPPAEKGPTQNELLAKEGVTFLKSVLQMYRYASARDMIFLFIGVIFTCIHGATFPILALFFGSISETFIVQSYGSHHNSSSPFKNINSNITKPQSNITSTDIAKRLMGGNNSEVTTEAMFGFAGSVIGSIGLPQGPLTKDEFVSFTETMFLIYLCMGGVVFISSFIQTYCFERVAENQAFRIRQNFLYSVLRQEIVWFESRPVGYLIVKLADDVERIREGMGHKMSIVLEYCACFAVGSFLGLSTNWKLAMIFGTSVPFILTKLFQITKEISKKAMDQQEEFGRAGAMCAEVLNSVKIVAAFGTEQVEGAKYGDELSSGIDLAIYKYTFIGLWTGILHIIIYGSYAGGFLYACNQLIGGNITPREIYTVFFCVAVGVLSLSNLLNFVPTTANAFGSSNNVNSVIDNVPKIDPYNDEGRLPKKVGGRIKFSNVTFNYPQTELPVIRDFSLVIEPATSVAIVGGSGSGKSTLVDLLLRFHDPQSGQISFDDKDLRNLNVSWLRDQIGVVTQDPIFQEATIFENIRGSRINADIKDVKKAVKLACADKFIEGMPGQYDAILSVTGKLLTTGEKQRLALARILFKNPMVLILDEATSGLDSNIAVQIYENIRTSRADRINIFISHNISHIQGADHIYVLQGGKIIEEGTQEDLIELKAMYRSLVQEENILESLEAKTREDTHVANEPEVENSDLTIGKPKKDSMDIDIDFEYVAFEYDESLQAPTFSQICIMLLVEENLLKYIVLAMTGAIISGCIMPLFSMVFSELFITFSKTGNELITDAGYWMRFTIAIGVLSAIGIWMRSLFVSACGEYLSWRLRVPAYITMLRQAIGWFDDDNHSVERIYTRLASDASFVKVAVGTRLGTAISAFVSLIAAIIIAFSYSWQIAIVVICGVPFWFLTLSCMIDTFEKHQVLVAKHTERAVRYALKSVGNIWTIQTLNLEHHVLRRFIELLKPAFEEAQKQLRTYSFMFALYETLSFIIFGFVFRLGAYLIDTAEIDSIYLFKAFIVLAFCTITMAHVGSFVVDYVKAKLAMAHIYIMFELPSTIDAFEEVGAKRPTEGEIEFKNVYFSYPNQPNDFILEGVSFKVEPGSSLGIIGATAGKSTLLTLVERFYDVSRGELLIDGVPINQLKLKFLRQNIGYVPQDPNLFDRTISENIAYGYREPDEEDELLKQPEDEEVVGVFRQVWDHNKMLAKEWLDKCVTCCEEEDKTEEEESAAAFKVELDALVESAAKDAFVSEFVEDMPLDYDTIVGKWGCKLTGGQRQRISMARAMMRNPIILLVDEPVAGLDPEDETLVIKALMKAKEGKTTIVSSNKASVIKLMDRVAVMVNGKIAEIGTHEELMGNQSFYYDFIKAS